MRTEFLSAKDQMHSHLIQSRVKLVEKLSKVDGSGRNGDDNGWGRLDSIRKRVQVQLALFVPELTKDVASAPQICGGASPLALGPLEVPYYR